MSALTVYAVEYGAYSDRYVSCIFARAEDAIAYLRARHPGQEYVESGDPGSGRWDTTPNSWGSFGYVEPYDFYAAGEVPAVGEDS